MSKKQEDKIQEIFDDADMECESENYHDRMGLTEKVFNSVKKFIPEEHRVKAAQSIAKVVAP